MNKNIQTKKEENTQAFKLEKSFVDSYNKMMDDPQIVFRPAQGSYGGSRGRDYSNLAPNISGRPGLLESDIDWFRPEEARPTNSKDKVSFGRMAYSRVGILKNAIDAMGDFTCQGIRLSHANEKIQAFYQDWFVQIGGSALSERLANMLFKEANAIVRMRTAKISKKNKREMQKAVAALYPEDIKANKSIKIKKNEIPWMYHIVDTLLVDRVGGHISNYSYAKPQFALSLNGTMKRELKNLTTSQSPEAKEIVSKMLPEMIAAMNTNQPVLLDQEKTYAFHYKKNPSDEWAEPIAYFAYDDLLLYGKLKLADRAALDGAINKIRVWKIGNLEYKVAPSADASSTLASMLSANTGGGTLDIIWGPDIELIETKTDIQSFLGSDKYAPTLMAIYACLGIPQTLTGANNDSGATNNYMSLKLLVERLNYVRSLIIDFWNEQIKIVQKAMDFAKPAIVEFDYMNFEDPSSIATLLTNLVDRNVLSEEFVHRFIKANTSLEEARIKREESKRDSGAKPDKAGPYHVGDKEYNLKKVALQGGMITPSQSGLELEDKKPGELTNQDIQIKQIQQKNKEQKDKPVKGIPGRPKNTKDTQKRKTPVFKPKSKAAMIAWAKIAQEKIAETITPVILSSFAKKNVRSLTNEQNAALEKIKFEILCKLEYGDELTPALLSSVAIAEIDVSHIHVDIAESKRELSAVLGRDLTINEVRDLQSAYFADLKYGDDE